MGDDGIHGKGTLSCTEIQVRNQSVSGFDGGDGQLATVRVPERREKLGYAGAHSGLARSELFGDILFSGA